jgi:hypothetical protein
MTAKFSSPESSTTGKGSGWRRRRFVSYLVVRNEPVAETAINSAEYGDAQVPEQYRTDAEIK